VTPKASLAQPSRFATLGCTQGEPHLLVSEPRPLFVIPGNSSVDLLFGFSDQREPHGAPSTFSGAFRVIQSGSRERSTQRDVRPVVSTRAAARS
jgi:hypothetical protein